MTKEPINKSSSFAVLDEALARLRAEGPAAIGDGVVAVLADRVRTAMESSDGAPIEALTEQLERFYREVFAAAPAVARAAARGAAGNGDAAAAFILGQAAFAHLLTARTLDRRADDRFLRSIRDRRYERYVRALQHEPLNGSRLGEIVKEREETVSRKLANLRRLGIVAAHKEGTSVVNSLTPAARGVLEHFRIAPLAPGARAPEVQEAMTELHDGLAQHLQAVPSFGKPVGRPSQRAA